VLGVLIPSTTLNQTFRFDSQEAIQPYRLDSIPDCRLSAGERSSQTHRPVSTRYPNVSAVNATHQQHRMPGHRREMRDSAPLLLLHSHGVRIQPSAQGYLTITWSSRGKAAKPAWVRNRMPQNYA
jgi:hypothetical protein